MSIKYITSVIGEESITHVLGANDKNVTVVFMPEKKCSYADRMEIAHFIYGKITVNDDMTIEAHKAHFAEILLAIELVNVIKEELNSNTTGE